MKRGKSYLPAVIYSLAPVTFPRSTDTEPGTSFVFFKQSEARDYVQNCNTYPFKIDRAHKDAKKQSKEKGLTHTKTANR